MASQRPDKATTELLRQSLAPNPAANGPCPEPEVLAAYFERSLSTEETARCELHLSGCVRCREELALMERAGEHTATGEESRSAAGRRLWIWDWRWLAPAAAVLIFATIWIVRRPSNSNRESQTLVAMSRPAEPLTKEAPIPSRAPGQGGAPAAPAPKSEMAQNRALNKTQNAISRQTIQPSTNEKMHEATSRDARGDADSNLAAKSAGAPQIDSEERAARKETESKALADALQTDRVSPAAAPPPPVQTANAGAMVQGEADESAQALKSKQQIAAAAGPNLYAKKDTKAAPEPGRMGGVARVVRTPDPKVLWQIPEQGLLKSENGGATWRPVDLPVASARVVFIAAPSAQVCWLVGRGGLILLTADGAHWQTVAPPAGADFVRVAAENASFATVSTAEGRRFQTSDGGKHWTPIQ
jgi:hypothetical protein